ncbi:MAG: hypothetical protein COV36_04235 [Alphaproteobacteria bacterium CG11_big_fil_rev_8_21_14_0_20_44_7]|nr:MAG: hypothetical protein COV36_04235 [Alphaproteobacteria bacterium CG11_big_fil_rev_8_21_14_0_20_44_7]
MNDAFEQTIFAGIGDIPSERQLVSHGQRVKTGLLQGVITISESPIRRNRFNISFPSEYWDMSKAQMLEVVSRCLSDNGAVLDSGMAYSGMFYNFTLDEAAAANMRGFIAAARSAQPAHRWS